MGEVAIQMEQAQAERTPPRAIQFPPLKPIFLLEDWEIPLRSQLPIEDALPYVVLIDDQLRVHFELNNWINKFHRPGFKDFMDPDGFYGRIAPQIIEGSLLKDQRRLIGGITGIYYPKGGYSDIHVVGLLPKEKLEDMDPIARRKAFKHMCSRLDDLNVWLGAREMRSGYTVIGRDKMNAVGWEKVDFTNLKQLWIFYKAAFPIWLRRRQGYYVKKLG